MQELIQTPILSLNKDNTEKYSRFSSILERISDEAAQRGFLARPFAKDSFAKLFSLTASQQEAIFGHLEKYLNLLRANELENSAGTEQNIRTREQSILQTCARKLEIMFGSDVYSHLTSEHIIEIYTQDLNQIYRNFSFFNLCSYSLLDLLTYPFHELYERSLQVNSLLMEAGQILSTRPYSLEPINLSHIPAHYMRERLSESKLCFNVEFKAMYPVYSWPREFYGYLVLQKARPMPNPEPGLYFI